MPFGAIAARVVIRDLVGFHGPASFRNIGLPFHWVVAVHVARH